MNKTDKFLLPNNASYLANRFYQLHVNTGGKFSYDSFAVQVPNLMKSWPKLFQINDYESLIYDAESEHDVINNTFIQDNRSAWDAGNEYRTLTATYNLSAEGYRLIDTEPIAHTAVSHNRYDNTIPLFQRSMNIRNYDNNVVMQDSLMQDVSSYDMQDIYDAVDKPYKPIDYLSVPYYGSNAIDDSSNVLLDTNWA